MVDAVLTMVGASAAVIQDVLDRVVACGRPVRVVREREAGDKYL